MTINAFSIAVFAAAVAATPVPENSTALMSPDAACHLGSYALSDGRMLAIVGYEGTPRDLEYVLSSGEFGHLAYLSPDHYRLGAEPGYGAVTFTDCKGAVMSFAERDKPELDGMRAPLVMRDVMFPSHATQLHGKRVLPASGKPTAIVVWIQGSDDDPATNDAEWQFLLPAHGIGVFVYDKRASGLSGGELSADFYVRADDTAAAVNEARKLVPPGTPVGVFGGSQGGWIAPLTATRTSVDFVIVGYGLAEGVTAQDRDEVEEQLLEAGYGADVIAKARLLTDATTRIVKSGWQDGWDEFDTLKETYSSEPWFKIVSSVNGFTGAMLQAPTDKIRELGPKLDKHISFNYDPKPVIEHIVPRQLWILGGSDRTAPSARTIAIIKDIQTRKAALDLAVYADADHGIVESFATSGVSRHRHPEGYFDLIANWVKADALPTDTDNLAIFRGGRKK
jgi:uncharacterized protein